MILRTLWSSTLVALALSTPAVALEPVNTTLFGDLALEGYDAVAYFTDARPVEGKSEYSHVWNGATWRFASAAHRDAFVAAPEKYAPQYGGYCAWAVSQGYTAEIDPEAWKIVDGKLFLNYDLEVQKRWEADIPGNRTRADANWPRLLAEE